jgi:hypothetical protein
MADTKNNYFSPFGGSIGAEANVDRRFTRAGTCTSCPPQVFLFWNPDASPRLPPSPLLRLRHHPHRPFHASVVAPIAPSMPPRSPPLPLPRLRGRPHRSFHASAIAPIAPSTPLRSSPSPLSCLRGRPHRPFHASVVAPIAPSTPPWSPPLPLSYYLPYDLRNPYKYLKSEYSNV